MHYKIETSGIETVFLG